MKIILVTEPTQDGVFVYTENLVRFLLEKQCEVHFAYSSVRSCDRLAPLLESIRAAGGETLDLLVGNELDICDVSAAIRLGRFCRRIRPDVLHAMSSKAGGLVRGLSLLGYKVPVVYQPHAYLGMSGDQSLRVGFFSAIESFLSQFGSTLAVSTTEAKFGVDQLMVSKGKMRTILNPVNLKRFRPPCPVERAQAREEFGLGPTDVVLGSMGRLAFQKNPQTLYSAFSETRKAHPTWKLLHVGRGKMAESLERFAKILNFGDSLIRRDYVSNPVPFYWAADLVVVSSLYEGNSLVVLEALACGCPVVLSDGPGVADESYAVLSHCWVAQRLVTESYVAAIEAWAQDRESRRYNNHREFISRNCAEETCFGAVIQHYRELCAERTGGHLVI